MHITGIFLAAVVSLAPLPQTAPQTSPQTPPQTPAQTPRRPAAGSATFAVRVTDPAGTPIGGVKVTLEGPAERQASTEQGRIAFENLPAGTYRLRFEREGFVTLEREQVARRGAPIDVKVTLTPAPEPPPPPAPAPEPPPPAPPAVDAMPVTIDLPAFIEKNFIGRDTQKMSELACSGSATATLIQLRAPLAEHTHEDWDEFLYVIAGQGTARVQTRDQPLTAGVFVMVPRGVAHTLAASGRSPLVLLSIRPGDRCAATGAAR
jgi:mannose-6-phosphate isomerase-like protein (cupin superfamily)